MPVITMKKDTTAGIEIMKLVVALFENDISPRLDCCTSMLVVDGAEEEIIDLSEATWMERLEEIVNRAPQALLCGGVRRCDYFYLVQSGIRVYSELSGLARERLVEALSGELPHEPLEFGNQEGPPCRRIRRGINPVKKQN